MNKAWVGFDLDGTAAVYDVWRGPTHIGAPIPETIARIKFILSTGMKVKIFTARVCSTQTPKDIEVAKETIAKWTKEHIGVALEATSEKDWSMLEYYDDRAVQVVFNTGKVVGEE